MATRKGSRGKQSYARNDFERSLAVDARADQAHLGSIASTWILKTERARGRHAVHDTAEVYDPKTDSIVPVHIPDKSEGARQRLELQTRRPVAGIVIKGKQLDKKTGKLVEVSDIHITRWSERSLLIQGTPTELVDTVTGASVPRIGRRTHGSGRYEPDHGAVTLRQLKAEDRPCYHSEDMGAPENQRPRLTGRANLPAKGVKIGSNTPRSPK